jgi:hypothetical protein
MLTFVEADVDLLAVAAAEIATVVPEGMAEGAVYAVGMPLAV